MQKQVLNNRYELAEKIGEGGMAEVYRAQDRLLDRPVAIKLLRAQYAADPEFVSRFQQEARSAARVAHPNIVGVYDVGSDTDASGQAYYYIVMELVEGASLKVLIRESAPLPVARAVVIISQTLAALGFAHKKGLIHRDIKPQNIIMAQDNHGKDLVKVADFGIARAANAPQLTSTGIVLATVQYCSPEQAMGRPATSASDIYSVGVVLYEMLTGQLPFEADTPVAVALMHIQGTPRMIRELNPQVPQQIENIVSQSLSKDPVLRFADAAQMERALTGYRQFGDEATATFTPLTTATIPAATNASGRAINSAYGAPSVRPIGNEYSPKTASTYSSEEGGRARPRRQQRGRVDWLAIGLGLLVFILVAAAIPLGLQLYGVFFGDSRSQPTSGPQVTVIIPPSPSAQASSTPEPNRPTVRPAIGAATETVQASQTLTTTATATITPTVTPTVLPKVKLPDLKGRPLEEAKAELEPKGIKFKVTAERYATEAKGVIIQQNPAPESTVDSGSQVEVVLSRGPESAPVPLVIGRTSADAKALLIDDGFVVDVIDDWSTRPVGTVFSQKPEGGDAPKGSTVTIMVSNGPRPPTPTTTLVRPPEGNDAWVPNVVGLPESVARERIKMAGLRDEPYATYQTQNDVPHESRDFVRNAAPGTVLSVSPGVGQKLLRDSPVKLAVKKP